MPRAPSRSRRRNASLALALALFAGLAWFLASLPEPEPARLELAAPPEERAVPSSASQASVMVAPPEPRDEQAVLAGRIPIEARASAADDSPDAPAQRPFEGKLVDSSSGEGLGGWRMGIQRFAPTDDPRLSTLRVIETLLTDPSGAFSTRTPLPAAKYRLHLSPDDCESDRGHSRVVEFLGNSPSEQPPLFAADLTPQLMLHDSLRGAVRIALRVGPRYRVHTLLPPGRATCDFEAHLTQLSGAALRHEQAGRLITGDPWVVIFAQPVRSAGLAPWQLRLRSTDGQWAGAALVDSISGTCAQPIVIELRPRARLSGRVVDAEGKSVEGADVRFLPDQPSAVLDFEVRALSDLRGAFHFESLPAGAGVLQVGTGAGPAAEQRVSLPAHGDEFVELELERLFRGTLAGSFSAEHGMIEHPPRLALRALAAEESAGKLPSARFVGAGGGRIDFRFEGVPIGEYELSVESLDGHVWEPARQRVQVPARDIEFRRLQRAKTMLVLEVLDAHDRSQVEGAFGLLVVDGRVLRSRDTGSVPGTLILDDIELDERATLRVGAADHRSQSVALGGLRSNGRFLGGTVLLERGAETLVQVVDAATGRPLEGAAIGAEGRVLARTDRDGFALLPAESHPSSPPSSLNASLAGWNEETNSSRDERVLVLRLRARE